MKKISYVLLVLAIVLSLFGCSASRVNTDYDEKANFNNYHTFRFTDSDVQVGNNPVYHSSLIDNTIHAQIAMELDARGIHEDTDHADLLIAYHTYTERKRQSINNYYPMMYGGYGWGFYPWGMAPYPYGYWNGYNRTYVYTEGTLIIDVIDAKSNQLIWRGSVSDAINTPNDLHHKAIRAVQVIFKKFPIKSNPSFSHDSKPVARKN
jgi:hypothetical protein